MSGDKRNNIYKLRKAKGLTLERLGALVGTDKTQMSKLENGKRKLTDDWLVKLAHALGCSINDIIPQGGVRDTSHAALTPPGEDIDERALAGAMKSVRNGILAGVIPATGLDDEIEAVLRYYHQATAGHRTSSDDAE